MITYNQEAFVAQAIESALAQRTDFPYEIVIGEDRSTDRTPDIVTDYARRYPDKIRPLLRDVNLGMNRNLVRTLHECTGEYVAVLEGDDYWCSSHKLQKQVDFLDAHPDYALCFHNVWTAYEDRSKEPERWHSGPVKETWTIDDLFPFNFINTCSVMFRRGLVTEFPERYYSLGMGDWPLHILNAQHGLIGYLDDVMAVYRIHNRGVWSHLDMLRRAEVEVAVLELLQVHLKGAYRAQIQAQVWRRLHLLAWYHAENGDYRRARWFTKRYARARILARDGFDRDLVRLVIRVYYPHLFRWIRALFRRTLSLHNWS